MKRIKCYSVRLESLFRISDKAYKATSYDGSSDIIPASQVFGRDYEVSKSEAWWISAWILDKKSITYSTKKSAMFKVKNDGKEKVIEREDYVIKRHCPAVMKPNDDNIIETLKK